MKKIFTSEYPDEALMREITEWIREQSFDKNGSLRLYSPTIVVELFDQQGNPLKEK